MRPRLLAVVAHGGLVVRKLQSGSAEELAVFKGLTGLIARGRLVCRIGRSCIGRVAVTRGIGFTGERRILRRVKDAIEFPGLDFR